MKIPKIFYSLICTFLLLIANTVMTNDQITLVENGASDYEIVIADNPSEKQRTAADILQSYLTKISSCTIPITSKSNETKARNQIYLSIKGEDPQQVGMVVQGKDLTISAGSDKALTHAIYEFLEKFLGCMWLAPEVEKVPSSKSVTIDADLDYNYSPDITTRTVHSLLFYDNPTFALKHKVTDKSFPFYVPGAGVHTFNKFLPEKTFYESHPEYYTLRNGRRLPTQLCLTNEKVLEIVKDSVSAMFARYPESAVISVSSNDNVQYCMCENCKAVDEEEGSHAGTMIRFVNEVAKAFPDKQISTLAYQYTRKPCKTKPLKNVLITLCSIECDRSASIEEKCGDFAEDLRGWKELTENIRIWDYTTQFTNYLAPFPNMHTLKPNIEFFRDNNAKWVFSQHSRHHSELFELRSYVSAKLLWNPEFSFSELVTEFTDAYYEEAGPFVKAYVDLIHEKLLEDEDFFLFLYGDPAQAFDSYLSAELLAKYQELFDKGEAAVAGKSEVVKRVRLARLGIDFAVLEACRKSLSKEFSLDNHKKVNTLLRSFRSRTSEANITMMNEMGLKVTEYCDFYEQTISIASQPNKARSKKVTLLTKPKKYADENPQALTDGAYGGSSFYANWLGFEGNNLEAVVDLGSQQEISTVSTAFLQVTNHIVFLPKTVSYYSSENGTDFTLLGTVSSSSELSKESKVNDIQYYKLAFKPKVTRFIKVIGENLKEAPTWHHAAGLPTWIFADEVIVN